MTPPDADVLLAGVRARCMALPDAWEGVTHGGPTWFVRRRSFVKFVDPAEHRAELIGGEEHVALWAAAPPGARRELPAAEPDRFFEPRFGGRGWVGMRLDVEPGGPDWDEVEEIVVDAYRQVAPKVLVARLDGQRS